MLEKKKYSEINVVLINTDCLNSLDFVIAQFFINLINESW